jgi:signal transduction histidine kinase
LGLFSFEGDLDAYLTRVTRYSLAAFEADGSSLFLRIDGSDTFVVAASAGISDLPWTASFRLGEGIAGVAATNSEPTVVDGEAGRADLESAMIAPLVGSVGDVVGVLILSRKLGSRRFTRDDFPTVSAIARHLALAAANAGLVARLKAAAERNASLADEFSGILNSLSSAVIALDGSGRLIQANRRAMEMIGFATDCSALTWEAISERLSDDSRGAVNRAVVAALNGVPCRSTVTEADGTHLAVSAQPSGNGVAIVIDDVTQNVSRERELERSRRLAEIGQMAAAVAHEIRNPLTSIRGAAQMIQSEADIAGSCQWAEVIEEEALELEGLCGEFLELSKEVPLNLSQVDLNSAAAKIAAQMDPEIQAAGAALRFTPDPSAPIISLDAARIGQALRNLIRNAVEAMPGGGTLGVSVRHDERMAAIDVTDTGIGIPEQDLQRLFTPFFTTKSRGTGLGLCNVRRIAEAHGGSVRAESKFGVGTTFTLELPVGSAD